MKALHDCPDPARCAECAKAREVLALLESTAGATPTAAARLKLPHAQRTPWPRRLALAGGISVATAALGLWLFDFGEVRAPDDFVWVEPVPEEWPTWAYDLGCSGELLESYPEELAHLSPFAQLDAP